MSPFAEHAQNTADYQAMLKGDDNSGGATLTFDSLKTPITIDCRFDRVIDDFILMSGESPDLTVPNCKFLTSDIPDDQKQFMRKNLYCILKPKPTWPPIMLKLWSGSIEQGGEVYLFMLVDRNFHA